MRGTRPGQVQRHISNTDKAEKLLGWTAKTSFKEGLLKTAGWYRENEAWWRRLIGPTLKINEFYRTFNR